MTATELNNVLANFYDKYFFSPSGKKRQHVHISFATLSRLSGLAEGSLIKMMTDERDNFQHVFGVVRGQQVIVAIRVGIMDVASTCYYHGKEFQDQTIFSRIL